MQQDLQVRVLRGPRRGAAAPLPATGALIGFGPEVELELDPQERAAGRLLLRPGAGGFSITVQAGQAALLGRTLGAGETVAAPLFVPIELQASTIAVGLPDPDRWRELERFVQERPEAPALATPPGAEASARRVPGLRIAGLALMAGGLGLSLAPAVKTRDAPLTVADVRLTSSADRPGMALLGAAPPPPAAVETEMTQNKRIVSVASGAENYIMTQDGARYYPGATLPSGHIVTDIDNGIVHLARDGVVSKMQF